MKIDCQACGCSCVVSEYEEWLGINPLFCPFCGEDIGNTDEIQEEETEKYLERIFEPDINEEWQDTELI